MSLVVRAGQPSGALKAFAESTTAGVTAVTNSAYCAFVTSVESMQNWSPESGETTTIDGPCPSLQELAGLASWASSPGVASGLVVVVPSVPSSSAMDPSLAVPFAT